MYKIFFMGSYLAGGVGAARILRHGKLVKVVSMCVVKVKVVGSREKTILQRQSSSPIKPNSALHNRQTSFH